MINRSLDLSLTKALEIAKSYNHEYATLEHLLLAILSDDKVINYLNDNNIDTNNLIYHLKEFIADDLSSLVNRNWQELPKPSLSFQKIIHRTLVHNSTRKINKSGNFEILSEYYLETDSKALAFLKQFGISSKLIFSKLHLDDAKLDKSNVKKNKDKKINMEKVSKPDKEFNVHPLSKKLQTNLDTLCVNLNDKARAGLIDMLVGRENEVQRAVEILSRRQKNNPLLVGEPGVGKTAIAEGLAYRIINKNVPDSLLDYEIFSLDIGSLVAGTKYRGDFEDRIKNLLIEIKDRKNIVLFIDEIHSIIGAGTTNTSSLDASNLIKPALARGEIRCIGSTTFKEFHQYFSKDAALTRRFQKIIIDEPNYDNTLKILQGLKVYYENHHGVKYEDKAIVAAVQLAERYIHDRKLPDKAIDLMDEAGAYKKITAPKGKIIVSEKDIENTVAKILNIPSITVAISDVQNLKKLEVQLKKVIFGQNLIIKELCATIKMAKAGLRESTKPTGCFLFVGPSGTGKTELAKQLAKFSNMELIRFDMSEYSEPHSISKLIGTPPGYSGFDQGGLLTEAVSKTPYSVVLFDEIEKAHKEAFNILLQIMDYGRLTDNTGKVVNFSHTIIILTANSGAELHSKKKVGFGEAEIFDTYSAFKILENTFSPEFLNRVDDVLYFNQIDNSIISLIIEKSIKEMSAQLADKNVSFQIDDSVLNYLTEQSFGKEKTGGARLLERVIDNEIKQPIAEEILFGDLKNGGAVKITAEKGKLCFKYKKHEISSKATLTAIHV